MYKKYCVVGLVIYLASFSAMAVRSFPMPALSKQTIEQKFSAAEQGFASRWRTFAKNRKFKPFPQQFDDQQILDEFEHLFATRSAVYYENPGQQPLFSRQEFERSQELLAGGYYKAPHLIAFAYNASHPSYNSSNVTLNGYRFLALEGPQKPAHVSNFKRLLVNYDVKKVVRLTGDIEGGKFKSENYWHGNVEQTADGKTIFKLTLPEEEHTQPYSLNYYTIDHWADNTGGDHETLLNLVQKVRKDYQPGEIIAVHCSAGVGRTGTFIAAFLLLDEIDKQLKNGKSVDNLKFSIEETVYKLSLQRAYLVGETTQYLTLHKLVQEYLKQA